MDYLVVPNRLGLIFLLYLRRQGVEAGFLV
jgi:hypothetical protein